VGLVTPLRDGMNLVAKEYVASQDARRSRRADPVALRRRGAADVQDALIVNPNSPEEISDALSRALAMELRRAQAPLGDAVRQRHGARTSPLGATTSWPSYVIPRRPRSSRTAPRSP
jgi:trehalose 6-phosphate synthase